MQELYFEKPILKVTNFCIGNFMKIVKVIAELKAKVDLFEDHMKQSWLILYLTVKLLPVMICFYCLYPQYLSICMTESTTETETAAKLALLYFGLALSQLQLMLQSHRVILKLTCAILVSGILMVSLTLFLPLQIPAIDLFIGMNCLLSCTKIFEQGNNLVQLLEQKLLVEEERSDTSEDEVKQSILELLSPRKPKVRPRSSML